MIPTEDIGSTEQRDKPKTLDQLKLDTEQSLDTPHPPLHCPILSMKLIHCGNFMENIPAFPGCREMSDLSGYRLYPM